MPTRAKQHRPSGFLPPGHSARARERWRGSAASRGYDSRWSKVARFYRQQHPLCVRCLKEGRSTVAELVDHIVPIRVGGALYDETNMQSLCRAHHDKKTQEDMRRWPEHYPKPLSEKD